MIGQQFIDSAWAQSRMGKFTASKIACLFTEPKSKEEKEDGGLSKAAKTYVDTILSEIVTLTHRDVDNNALQWGNDNEPRAAEELAKIYPDFEYFGQDNPQFFPYNSISGGSPDAAAKKAKMVFEIKSPENPANHIEYLRLVTANDLYKSKKDYFYQINFNMVCMAKFWDVDPFDVTGVFVSYDPRVLDDYAPLRLKQLKIKLDREFYEALDPILEKHQNYLLSVIRSLNI